MIRALTYVALVITITAGCAVLYRTQPYSIKFERAGEVKKDQEQVPAKPVPVPAFGPVPNVVVQSMPAPTITEPPSTTAPTPAPVIHKPHPKHAAVKKLQSKWVAPEAKPFDIKDLFK